MDKNTNTQNMNQHDYLSPRRETTYEKNWKRIEKENTTKTSTKVITLATERIQCIIRLEKFNKIKCSQAKHRTPNETDYVTHLFCTIFTGKLTGTIAEVIGFIATIFNAHAIIRTRIIHAWISQNTILATETWCTTLAAERKVEFSLFFFSAEGTQTCVQLQHLLV